MDFGTGGGGRVQGIMCVFVWVGVNTQNDNHMLCSRVMCSQAGEAGELFQAWGVILGSVVLLLPPPSHLTLMLYCVFTLSERSLLFSSWWHQRRLILHMVIPVTWVFSVWKDL